MNCALSPSSVSGPPVLPQRALRKAILGDSMLKGIPDWKRTSIYPIGGETLSGLTDRVLRDFSTLEQFDIIAFMSGTNDVAKGASLEQIKARYGRLRKTLRAFLPEAQLVVISLLPRPCDYDPKIKLLNKWLQHWAAHHRMVYIKAFQPFKHGHEGIHEDLYGRGKLHLKNKNGKVILHRLLQSQLGDKNIRRLVGRLQV